MPSVVGKDSICRRQICCLQEASMLSAGGIYIFCRRQIYCLQEARMPCVGGKYTVYRRQVYRL